MHTILVIDDDLIILQTLCMILNENAYRAIGAENSQQAEHQFANNIVDLIIVDHGPAGSGSELAKQFKETKPVLALMLSGSAELGGTPAAVDLLLPKPCAIPDLLAGIEGLFAGAAAA
jgi:DNA-binding response OmpR family regulator